VLLRIDDAHPMGLGELTSARARLDACVERALLGPAALLASYGEFTAMLRDGDSGWLEEFREEQRDLDEYRAALQTLRTAADRAARCSYDTEAFGLIKVHADS
jgi:hypothetical protein